MIEDSAILTKEEVDEKHDDMQSDLETKYEEINSLIEGWFERE